MGKYAHEFWYNIKSVLPLYGVSRGESYQNFFKAVNINTSGESQENQT